MKKIVINECFGGFGLSESGLALYNQITNQELKNGDEVLRDNPALIEVVETLGKKSWGYCAKLKIVKIPDNVEWEIEEYDGMECVAEKHRIWQ